MAFAETASACLAFLTKGRFGARNPGADEKSGNNNKTNDPKSTQSNPSGNKEKKRRASVASQTPTINDGEDDHKHQLAKENSLFSSWISLSTPAPAPASASTPELDVVGDVHHNITFETLRRHRPVTEIGSSSQELAGKGEWTLIEDGAEGDRKIADR